MKIIKNIVARWRAKRVKERMILVQLMEGILNDLCRWYQKEELIEMRLSFPKGKNHLQIVGVKSDGGFAFWEINKKRGLQLFVYLKSMIRLEDQSVSEIGGSFSFVLADYYRLLCHTDAVHCRVKIKCHKEKTREKASLFVDNEYEALINRP